MTEQPDPDAYRTTGVLEARCPNCGAEPGAWCHDDDGRGTRRIPCVGRLAAAVRKLRGGTDPDEPTTMNREQDLTAGYPQYRRPPPDRVPKTPKADLPPIETGPGSYKHEEISGSGVTREAGPVFISRPFVPKTPEGEQE